MNNIKEYYTNLSSRDKLLLVFSLVLLGAIFYKFFVYDTVIKKQQNLISFEKNITKQASIMQNLLPQNGGSGNAIQSSDNLVSAFLNKASVNGRLKQMRTNAKGEQQVEIEDIEFDEFLNLIELLRNNNTQYSNLQLKKQKSDGLINASLTLSN